ncbi:MAG: acyl-ACP--UDP-N-acetylglucosamine O-acyltransferase [Planctomycetota bacterium]
MTIHPSAIISSSVELGNDVDVGAYCIIESGVKVADGCRIRARAHLCSGTVLGKNCEIHMNAVIGHVPQDFSYRGEPLKVVLGDHVTVRENATIHGATGEIGTQIGDGCFLMVGSHVAHNCKLGKNVILANGALLAGYVEIGDDAFISGNVVIHQFVRVGALAILSGGSRFGMDVPPYLIGDGVNSVTTLNVVGLRRAKYLTDADRQELKHAYKILYRSDLNLKEALEKLRSEFKSSAIMRWIEFFSQPSKRGFCRHRANRRANVSAENSD